MTPPRRRWFAFSLRTLFVGVTLTAILIAQYLAVRTPELPPTQSPIPCWCGTVVSENEPLLPVSFVIAADLSGLATAFIAVRKFRRHPRLPK